MSSVGEGASNKVSLQVKGNGVKQQGNCGSSCFRMPLHYPRYTRADYEAMPEWKLNCLLSEYGLHIAGDVDCKRRFAMGAFLWPAK